jgi:hypothetical protein
MPPLHEFVANEPDHEKTNLAATARALGVFAEFNDGLTFVPATVLDHIEKVIEIIR